MPELPEVETTRRGMARLLKGRHIEEVELRRGDLRFPFPKDFAERLQGARVTAVRRRAKYLLFDLDTGDVVLAHLGMSGSFRVVEGEGYCPKTHDHVIWLLDNGQLCVFHDPRRFGAVVFTTGEQSPLAQKLLGGLGMEPLSDGFSFDAFRQGLRATRAPIKQVLLAGKVVVGVGNIYASEVLFLAGIRPTVPAASIGDARLRRLHTAIREVLALAVERGGTTLKDFSSADGNPGHFQLEARVYGREGAPCLACGTPIRGLKQGQRSSYFCPRCQRA